MFFFPSTSTTNWAIRFFPEATPPMPSNRRWMAPPGFSLRAGVRHLSGEPFEVELINQINLVICVKLYVYIYTVYIYIIIYIYISIDVYNDMYILGLEWKNPSPLSYQTPTCFNLEWIFEWISTHFSIQADVGFEPLFFLPGSYPLVN